MIGVSVAIGIMLVASLLLLGHNARHRVIRKRWLWPLMGTGPVGIPVVMSIVYSGAISSPGAAMALLFIGSGFCFAVWVATAVGYGVFNATRDQPRA